MAALDPQRTLPVSMDEDDGAPPDRPPQLLLRERLLERAPGLDPLDLELTLTLLTSGLATIARRWLEEQPTPPTRVSPDARAAWDRLLDRLLHRLRAGHAG